MQINESRANSRGPLIAVIKIQIDTDQIDRIFLHQNDDEYRLAEQFQQKHNLNPAFIEHIYQRIKMMSKESLRRDTKSPVAPNNLTNRTAISDNENYRNRREQEGTPFNKISTFTPVKQNEEQINFTKNNFAQNYKDLESIGYESIHGLRQNQFISEDNIFKDFQSGANSKGTNSRNHYVSRAENEKEKSRQNIGRIIERENKIDSIYQIEQHTANRNEESHYSFNQSTYNQNKPSRVKVITKNKIDQNSSMGMKRSLSKAEISRISKNVTSRLYNESQIKKNYLQKIKERVKVSKQEEEQLKQLTHHPQINKISKMIANGRYGNNKVEDYLIMKAKDKQIRIQKEVIKKTEKQMENCSFKPEINQVTRKLTRDRSLRVMTERQKNEKKQCLRHSHSKNDFRPSLNKVSQEIVKNKGSFEHRQKCYLQKKNQKLHKRMQQKKKDQIFTKQGQQFFKPKLRDSTLKITARTRQKNKGDDVHDYLYEMSKNKKEVPVEEAIPKINENSTAIVQQIHHKRLAYVFSELDSDQDGFISAKKICIQTIKQNLLQVIMPVLFQMEEMQIELNFYDFKKAIENLHASLNTLQKGILYDYHGSSKTDKTHAQTTNIRMR